MPYSITLRRILARAGGKPRENLRGRIWHARTAVRLDQVVQIACRRTVDAQKHVLDELRDLEKADAPFEERADGDLVRRVERARERPTALTGVARAREERTRLGG